MIKLIGFAVLAIVLAIVAMNIISGILSTVIPAVLVIGAIWIAIKIFSSKKGSNSKQTF